MEQRLQPGLLPRHRHRNGYAAIVLSGGYVEAGLDGRWRVEPGDVVAHGAFDAHQNILVGGAWVLNLPLRSPVRLPPVFRVRDPDELERAVRSGGEGAWGMLIPLNVGPVLADCWPDLLATDLRARSTFRLGAWARRHGITAETVSRGFYAAFGVTPARYRAELRARAAWRDIRSGAGPLSGIAYDHGFADQAHMTRAVTRLTGSSPRAWRHVNSVQDPLGPSTEV